MTNKDLDYYMSLPYTIEIIPITESLGGGFTARLPQIGEMAISGDGETPEEAIKNLDEFKRGRFEDYITKGVKIPEPEEEIDEFSGRFVTRVPRILHKQLVTEAKKNGSSLNQFVNFLLSTKFILNNQQREFSMIIEKLDELGDIIWDINLSRPKYDLGDLYGEASKPVSAEIYYLPKAA